MKSLWIVLGVVGVIILVLLFGCGSYVSTKNTLVQKNEAINQAYSQVNVVQQRRLDLIPNLVASVKGYVSEESTVLTNIANARAAITSAPDRASNIAANSKLDVALGPFFRLQEQYPNLKGNEQFMRLTDELAGTENRIAVERSRYNSARRLQRLRSPVPQQHLGQHGRLPLQGRILQGQPGEQCGAEGRLLDK